MVVSLPCLALLSVASVSQGLTIQFRPAPLDSTAGCSSEVALFGENGPCKVSADGSSTSRNEYSWNSKANVLYIDQPAGTGFSYGAGMDHNEQGVATDMYDFLQQFLKSHTKYKDLPFFAV